MASPADPGPSMVVTRFRLRRYRKFTIVPTHLCSIGHFPYSSVNTEKLLFMGIPSNSLTGPIKRISSSIHSHLIVQYSTIPFMLHVDRQNLTTGTVSPSNEWGTMTCNVTYNKNYRQSIVWGPRTSPNGQALMTSDPPRLVDD